MVGGARSCKSPSYRGRLNAWCPPKRPSSSSSPKRRRSLGGCASDTIRRRRSGCRRTSRSTTRFFRVSRPPERCAPPFPIATSTSRSTRSHPKGVTLCGSAGPMDPRAHGPTGEVAKESLPLPSDIISTYNSSMNGRNPARNNSVQVREFTGPARDT